MLKFDINIKLISFLLVLSVILPSQCYARDLNLELINAVRDGRISLARDLIAEGADVNSKNGAGKTALMMAASFGNVRIVDLLLAEGADVRAKDKMESTALIDAAYNGNIRIIKALLAWGADPAVEAKNGVSALSTAKTLGHEEVAKLLENTNSSDAKYRPGRSGKKILYKRKSKK